MPRWSKKKKNDLKTNSSESVPKIQSTEDSEDGPDPAALIMADSINNADSNSSITNRLKLMRTRSEDSDADLEKGRYGIEGQQEPEPEPDAAGEHDRNYDPAINLSQSTEPSVKLKKFWKGMKKSADGDSVASGNLNDKYLLFDDDGNPVKRNRDDRSAPQNYDHDDDRTLSTIGSFIEKTSRNFGRRIRSFKDDDDETWKSFTYSMDGLSYTGNYDAFEVKQKYGYCSIGMSIIQLFIMIVMMGLCGVAPLEVNPMVGPYPDSFSYWGGKNAWLITQQFEIYRVATPVFLHVGVIHLFCNVAIQLETGAFFEREWGSGTWFLIYILSAIGSSIVSCISQPDTISVGASGALMGLFGAKLGEVIMFSCSCVQRSGESKSQGIRMEQFSGLFCSITILCLFILIPYVDWAGHVGGFVVGFLVGICIFSWSIDGLILKCLWGTFGLACLISSIAYAFYYMYTEIEFNPDLEDVCNFYRQIYREGYECTCQYTFGMGDGAFYDDDDWGN